MNQSDIVCKSLIACEKTSLDPQSKLLSLTNLLDRIFVTVGADEVGQVGTTYKQIRLPLELVVFWERGTAVGEVVKQFKVHFADPSGKMIFDHVTSDVKMRAETRKFYSLIKLGGLPCAQSGRHAFQVYINDGSSDVKLLEEYIDIVMVDERGVPLPQ
jgi:hypothetical protein